MGYITNYWNIFWYEHIQLDIFITTNTMGYNIYIYIHCVYIYVNIYVYIYTHYVYLYNQHYGISNGIFREDISKLDNPTHC